MSATDEEYTRNALLLLFIIFWVFNPSIKALQILFFLFTIALWIKIKKLDIAIILTYIVTNVFYVGKVYLIPLINTTNLPVIQAYYPSHQLLTSAIITYSDIYAIFIFALLIRQILTVKISFKRLIPLDYIVMLFLFWMLGSNILFSSRPILSILSSLSLFKNVLIYLYIRLYIWNQKYFFTILLSTLSIVIIFEGFLVLQQLIYQAPVGKNFESATSIEVFGNALDEWSLISRPNGTFSYTNSLGIYMAVIFPLILSGFLIFKNKGFFVSLILGLIVIISTLSRSAWIAFFFSIMTFIYVTETYLHYNYKKLLLNKKIIVAGMVLIPFIVLFFLPRLTRSMYSFEDGGLGLRIQQFKESINLIQAKPLGVGTNLSVVQLIRNNPNGTFAHFPSSPLNYYLTLTIENGFPALLFYLYLCFYSLVNSFCAKGIFPYAIMSSIIALMLSALFQSNANFMFLFLACSLNVNRLT